LHELLFVSIRISIFFEMAFLAIQCWIYADFPSVVPAYDNGKLLSSNQQDFFTDILDILAKSDFRIEKL